MKIRCRKCGKVHEEWPSLEFCSPFYYSRLTKFEKEKLAELRTDFCIIKSDKQKDYFIRAILTQKVTDHCDSLEYSVWILLNEQSFADYDQHFYENDHKTTYFGYLSNQIPGYDDTLSVSVTVHTNKGMERPDVIPHPDQSPNRFVSDYYKGISADDVSAKIKYILGDT